MSTLDEILGNTALPSTDTLIDNWQTAFIWLVLGVIAFAFIALVFGIKRAARGENVNKGMLPYVKWPLLFASAGFNVFFTYYVFLPAGQTVAAFSAVVMGGVNLAEAYLVRLIIATWRHDMKLVFRLALLFTVPVFIYSLMAAGSSFSTMMMKNKDTLAASQLELQSAQDRIGQAKAEIKEAQASATQGDVLVALYQTEVRNSRGVKVGFNQVKNSCDAGGYYSIHYPALCQQYINFRDGTHTAQTVASAHTQALATSASEKLKMAQIIKDRPPEITPTLLGFGLGIAAVGFIVSLALESAIIGVGFFEELFIKPTPLPAIVSFMNKSLDWNADTITQRGLQVDVAPSPGAVNFANNGQMVSPFSSVGWSPQNPEKRMQNASVAKRTNGGVGKRDNAPVALSNARVSVDNVPVETPQNVPKNTLANAGIDEASTHPNNALKLSHDMEAIKQRLMQASNANIGEDIACVICGTATPKRTDTKRFCGAKCRGEFHTWAKQQQRTEADKA